MAKRYKKNKRARHHKGTRHDYRGGGRVALQRGGLKDKEPGERDVKEPSEKDIRDTRTSGSFSISRDEQNRPQPIPQQPVTMQQSVTESPVMPAQPTSQPAQQPVEMGRPAQQPVEMQPIQDDSPQPIEYEASEEDLGRQIDTDRPILDDPNDDDPRRGRGRDRDDDDTEPPEPPVAPDPEKRAERIERTARTVESSARGKLPRRAIIPDAEQVDTSIAAETKQLTDEDLAPATAGTAASRDVTAVTGTAATTAAPDQITAAGYGADITGSAVAQAAQGQVSEDAELTEDEIAQAADVVDVAPIEGADVDIPVGALTDRVVGVMSEGAKAVAAQNTGSSLRKLSRAKKQLRKAGLTEDQIGEIGDDIEALEDRLDDFTEEQRGIIAGVDKDTLVDAQMSRLLDGMEEGQIPLWAQGAVGQVEQMLAARGLSASTVGRASLTNAILQSALPMAQSNATALQQAATQQRDIEAKESEANTARRQQTALTNANNVFQMDMANFSAEVQRQASNSKFLQTVGLQEASFEQQGVVQDALLMSQANLAEADFYQKAQIQNAQAFLQTDMANLNNLQQANVLKAQQEQQRLLSNQSAENAARNANMVSENQTQQFMASLNTQTKQFNAQQSNAMKQFNAAAENAASARDSNRTADMNKFNSQLLTQVEEFNSQQDFARNQWEAQNTAVVEASNVEWRRKINTVNTAAQNQVNMQNAMNAYGLSTQSLSFLWQELRDNADYDFRSAENAKAQVTQLRATAIANEAALAEKSKSTIDQIVDIVEGMIGNYYDT